MLRTLLLVATALVVNLHSPGASAQTYPQRTVKFILPFGPASGTDITARLIADRLAARVESGELGNSASGLARIGVALRESHIAWASYERSL